jgi:uncharacterized protein
MFVVDLKCIVMNRLELVRNEIDVILLNQTNVEQRPLGYIHLYGVSQNCVILALKRGLNVELCAIIGILHDFHTYKFGYVKEHAALGAVEVENILRDLEIFSEKEVEIIKTAINNHSDKENKHDKYSELIKDADVLQNSIYSSEFEIKHKKRLKKVFKDLGIKVKLKNGILAKKNFEFLSKES